MVFLFLDHGHGSLSTASSSPDSAAGRLQAFDARLAAAELRLAALLLLAMLLCMGAGAVMRSVGQPLIWSDELAVLLMVAAAFFAASSNLSSGAHVAVDLLARRLPARAAWLVEALLFALLAGFLACLWVWLDPVGLWGAGSGAALARESGNFTYTEPTMTLGVAKIWFWLPMLPATLGALVHMAARLARRPRSAPC